MEARLKAQHTTRTAPPPIRRFGLHYCPNCNDMLLAPALSEHVSDSHIRHFWSCETCEHEFTSSVRLRSGRVRELATSLC
jgi:RNase P subunit RPR2